MHIYSLMFNVNVLGKIFDTFDTYYSQKWLKVIKILVLVRV